MSIICPAIPYWIAWGLMTAHVQLLNMALVGAYLENHMFIYAVFS